MLLSELLTLELQEQEAWVDRPITGLSLDSRQVRLGDVFFALAGTQAHGDSYTQAALENGAVAVLKEAPIPAIEKLDGDIPAISIVNLSQKMGKMAARFYGHPSEKMQVIGVTGTNGKTSVTHAIAQLLQSSSRSCGLLGTLGYGTYGALEPGLHTTPDAIRLQGLLAQLGTDYMVMEVSSHALAQGRVNGIHFDTAVLTNLSRDHLDYHQTMAAYGDAKRQLFLKPDLKTAIINLDDKFGLSVLKNLPDSVTRLTYSIQNQAADVYGQISAYNTQGCEINIQSRWGNGLAKTAWFGEFNVSNILAALTVLLHKGLPLAALLEQLATLRPVPGRMERFGKPHQPTIIIDYAHTPDALEKALLALSEHKSGTGNLWCVFGCGGNRDKGKRSLMGEVAQRYADKIIITDDNPRHEASQSIIDDILQGCPTPLAVIPDRYKAIIYALQNAKVGDMVLIAGKGHEDYQEIGNQRLPFSDRELVESWLMN
jgi:UDP-N-acetylmuramoyl-L-alanyl-D-glutamate--2,6-diaminopimelate ligase